MGGHHTIAITRRAGYAAPASPGGAASCVPVAHRASSALPLLRSDSRPIPPGRGRTADAPVRVDHCPLAGFRSLPILFGAS